MLMEPTEKKVTPHVVDFATIIPEGSCERDSGDFRERCVSLLFDVSGGEEE